VAKAFSPKTPLVIGAVAYGLFIYALLPQGIVALNDDFGYLRSVVATLQHGRPWTDDWLEPWAAGLSLSSALLFKATGSFYFATYGLLALLAAVAFFAAGRLLARNLPIGRVLVLTTLGLTFPTLLWKQVQFTGLALYLPCLLVALWAAESRRWGAFFAAWVLALSTRQSALAWAALPVAALVTDWLAGGKSGWRRGLAPALSLFAGIGLYLALARFMNKTVAQQAITDRMWAHWSLAQATVALRTGGIALLLAAGLGAWAQGGIGLPRAGENRRWLWVIGVGVAGVFLLAVNVRDHVACEFPTFDSIWGAGYVRVGVALGAAGLALGRFSWRPLPLAGALLALMVLSLRGAIWDYYLLDVCLFGFFAVEAAAPGGATAGVLERWVPRIAVGVSALFHAGTVLPVKSTLDRTHVLFDLGSRALEEGRLEPQKASFLPFGLMAWYYFPLHVRDGWKPGTDLVDFGGCLEQDTVLIAWRYSRPLRRLPGHHDDLPEDRRGVIVGGKFNYCWLYGVEVLLLPAPPGNVRAAKRPYPANYRLPTFPRDDAGWRDLIAGETKLAAPQR
jgi:hypothetical protein